MNSDADALLRRREMAGARQGAMTDVRPRHQMMIVDRREVTGRAGIIPRMVARLHLRRRLMGRDTGDDHFHPVRPAAFIRKPGREEPSREKIS